MGHVKYQRRIFLLRKENRNLKWKLRFITKRETLLNQYIKKIQPDLDGDVAFENKAKVKYQNHHFKILDSPMLLDLYNNLTISANNREYSLDTKLFAYTLYSISSGAYRFLSSVLPFPSEQILKKKKDFN